MSVLRDWRERHPRDPGGIAKVAFLALLLAFVVFLILKSDILARGFTSLVSPDTSGIAE